MATTQRRKRRRRNPRGGFLLLARRGRDALYYTGNKFAKHGKPVIFPSLVSARLASRVLWKQYPALRSFTLSARRV